MLKRISRVSIIAKRILTVVLLCLIESNIQKMIKRISRVAIIAKIILTVLLLFVITV